MPTNSTIGMSVPGLSPAGQALSLYTGASVADQVNQESEDERRKKLARLAAAQQNGGDTRPGGLGGFGAALSVSPAGISLGF
jgi:hypothetical protein